MRHEESAATSSLQPIADLDQELICIAQIAHVVKEIANAAIVVVGQTKSAPCIDQVQVRLRRQLVPVTNLQAEIVDLRTLRPLDMEPVLESFKKTNRAIVVEEGWKSYGVGSEVASRIYEEAFDYVDAPVIRVAQKEVPLPYNRTLEQAALPQVPDIVAAVKEVLK